MVKIEFRLHPPNRTIQDNESAVRAGIADFVYSLSAHRLLASPSLLLYTLSASGILKH
jgi:hypothetical protein